MLLRQRWKKSRSQKRTFTRMINGSIMEVGFFGTYNNLKRFLNALMQKCLKLKLKFPKH